jgi:hypothetical protein
LSENLGVPDKVLPLETVQLLEILEERDARIDVGLFDDFTQGKEDLGDMQSITAQKRENIRTFSL